MVVYYTVHLIYWSMVFISNLITLLNIVRITSLAQLFSSLMYEYIGWNVKTLVKTYYVSGEFHVGNES